MIESASWMLVVHGSKRATTAAHTERRHEQASHHHWWTPTKRMPTWGRHCGTHTKIRNTHNIQQYTQPLTNNTTTHTTTHQQHNNTHNHSPTIEHRQPHSTIYTTIHNTHRYPVTEPPHLPKRAQTTHCSAHRLLGLTCCLPGYGVMRHPATKPLLHPPVVCCCQHDLLPRPPMTIPGSQWR